MNFFLSMKLIIRIFNQSSTLMIKIEGGNLFFQSIDLNFMDTKDGNKITTMIVTKSILNCIKTIQNLLLLLINR